MSSYTIPTVIARDARSERALDVYSHLLGNRIIYLGTPLDDGVANVIIAQLLHLEAEAPERQIDLYINSPGGSLTAMTAVLDTMNYISAPVATMCVGQAVADAAILLAAGAAGKRSALPHARMVLRQPQIDGGRAAIPDLIVAADEVIRQRDELESILVEVTGRHRDQLRADMDRDKVLTAPAAVDYGLIDHIAAARS